MKYVWQVKFEDTLHLLDLDFNGIPFLYLQKDTCVSVLKVICEFSIYFSVAILEWILNLSSLK